MEPVYGRHGQVVAWLEDNRELIRDLGGRVNAWVHDDCVYSLRGAHVGHFVDGNFRDTGGAVVAYISGAAGGPIKPVKAVTPVRPVRGVRPVRPVRSVRMVRPMRSSGWSQLTFDAYVAGR